MSKTYKKEKSAEDFKYWSDRWSNKGGSSPGTFAKKLAHKKERKLSRINPRFIEEEDSNA